MSPLWPCTAWLFWPSCCISSPLLLYLTDMCVLCCRGHKLVEEYSSSALAWFGVGCYYMASKQYEQARRFFAKATQLDKHNAHAWIGFGHAFAEQVCACGLRDVVPQASD